MSESVRGLFKRMAGLPAAFYPTWMVRIPIVFHSQMLWGLLFLAPIPWAGEAGVRVPGSFGGTSSAKVSLLILNHHKEVWGLFRVSVPPTRLDVVSLYFLLQDFCSARLQMVLLVDCSSI